MPWARPSLTQLRNQVQQDINASPIGLQGFLRNAILPILGWAQAGLAYLHYAYLDYIAKQAVPWTAEDEWLYGWAALKGVYQKDASTASGPVTFSGAGTIPAGTLVNRPDGVQFIVTEETTVTSAAIAVPVAAVDPGAAGNTTNGTSMVLASPIGGIISLGTAGEITGGADQETQESFRSRMLMIYAAPPQGGDAADYVEWALAVDGVTRAWVTPNGAGAGTVVVYPMFDDAEAANGGFPGGTDGVAANETRANPATGDQLT
ncbi:baseplate J/gp47 family protein, partial [Thioclava sp. BHET1]